MRWLPRAALRSNRCLMTLKGFRVWGGTPRGQGVVSRQCWFGSCFLRLTSRSTGARPHACSSEVTSSHPRSLGHTVSPPRTLLADVQGVALCESGTVAGLWVMGTAGPGSGAARLAPSGVLSFGAAVCRPRDSLQSCSCVRGQPSGVGTSKAPSCYLGNGDLVDRSRVRFQEAVAGQPGGKWLPAVECHSQSPPRRWILRRK